MCRKKRDSLAYLKESASRHPFQFKASFHGATGYSRYTDIVEDICLPDISQDEINTGLWWRHLLAGGVAGAVSRTCTAPLDRMKVFLQVHGTKHLGMQACIQLLFQEGGFWSFWRGNGINIMKIAPESAIKFTAYEECKIYLHGADTDELLIYERIVAGSFAGVISQTAIYPLEVLKTRLTLSKTGQYKGIVDAAINIYKKEGLRYLYRGYIPNLLGIMPYSGIDLAVYETVKNSYLAKFSDDDTPSALLSLACGTISSTCGQVCSYPLALVTTRLQAQVITNEHGSPIVQKLTLIGVIRTIMQHEGFFGLYRGLAPNFMKVIPAVSISYIVYERFRQILGISMR